MNDCSSFWFWFIRQFAEIAAGLCVLSVIIFAVVAWLWTTSLKEQGRRAAANGRIHQGENP